MIRFRHLTLAMIGALAFAPAAFAQDASTDSASGKRFAIVGGYALTQPTKNPQIAGTRTDLDGDGAPTLSASYFINDNIAIEAWGAADKFGHRVNAGGGKIGSVDSQPIALSGQYHFRGADTIVRPFVGLGYYEANYSNESLSGGQRLGVENAKGAMATAGVDLNINPTWFARADVRYMQGKPDVKLDGVKVGEAELNPVTVGVGIGARF
ncbi:MULTISPECIES: OmpW family outer membrane protein [unclassified Lysobacter]|uniref:OmpW/AlkL family protein n=1 Tax=unclassified Lysobacter TaxID=2635362 RepID=UPI001BECB9B3|nr:MULTISPECIES: OmpW family outer membrane protein [unclassified Lysobacter]MBT2748476.1 outer membrane beta-barrel protein [Lysobacter sp. ISL-42]MBT2752594.1 outer membrane beta-barrel protein [Lysobacter sp. ISL-50]MBT2776677.1 outer membrane beta-barrel protein [Lysobacter sp. ISL-54]MBT2782548.1 outer membrane beta-barrel protein [Lysobacter sp. ISL-52]